MTYLYLAIAIVAEVVATSALKASEAFTKPGASLIVVIGYGIAFYLLTLGPVNTIEKPSLGPFFPGTRRIERGVLTVRKRNATQFRGKMAPARRVAPQKGPCGVTRRSFGVTKLLSSCLAWPLLGRQR